MDAPAHVLRGGNTVDQLPIDKFIGHGIVIDVRDLSPKSEITKEVIESKLKDMGISSCRDMVVLFHTGYDKYIGTSKWYEHPGLGVSGAKFLIDESVKCVGIDAPSIDHESYPAHKLLLENDIPIIENLTNLEKLLGRKFKFVALPLSIVRRFS